MKAALACTCGACWKGTMPDEAWRIVMEKWNQVHAGPGHAPCTAREAGRQRIRIAARELRQSRTKDGI